MDDCIFCKIVKGKLPAKVQGKTKNVIAFDSISPVSKHHILIVPKKHLTGFMEIKSADSDLLIEAVGLAQKIIREKKISEGFKLVINGGKYQAINHFHWHLLGGKLENEGDVLNKT